VRKSDGFGFFIGTGMLLLVSILIQAHFVMRANLPLLQQKAAVAKNLGLTDLCLSTEARYTRHLSQADWHAAFQTHPLAQDHFPSGSVFAPPETLKKSHDQID
jgi:hypothetical protein